MRLSLLFLLIASMTVLGCRTHEKEPEGEGGTGTEVANNDESAPKDNEPADPDPEPDDEEEICLLPPEALDSDLGGKIKVGQMAPDFVIGKTAAGNELKLSDHRGKTVLLFFWATWCPYCKLSLRQRGSMNTLGVEISEMDDPQLVIVGIGTGTDDSAAGQEAFMKTNEVPWSTIHDEGSEVEGKYGILGVPTAVVIGRDGKIQSYGFYRKDAYQKPLLEYLRQECTTKPEGS